MCVISKNFPWLLTAEYFQSFDHLLLVSKNEIIKLISVSQMTEGKDTVFTIMFSIRNTIPDPLVFKPATVYLLAESTLSTKIPNPFYEPQVR